MELRVLAKRAGESERKKKKSSEEGTQEAEMGPDPRLKNPSGFPYS